MNRFSKWTVLAAAALLTVSCGFRHKKYDNPITKNTQQPDKVLFDKAVKDIEKGRYEVARLTLNTLINTYDTSEFLAKAKLAVADSWFREGGTHGLAQAEAEYKDFILFYPTMEEAAESQKKICDIHYKQMDKADRDSNQALRAEQECRQLLVQFPNSKFAPVAEQQLREIQEVLAEAEMRAGSFYHKKGALAAAANRLGSLVDQYPLYSKADEALWLEGDSFVRLGPRFKPKGGEAYQKLVKEYPLSSYTEQAKKKLREMEMEIPAADPAAVARMKFEQENRKGSGVMSKSTSFLRRGPDVKSAAKSGSPAMTNNRPSVPASVPPPSATAGVNDVTIAPAGGSSALDTQPDARANPTGASAGEVKPEGAAATDAAKPAETVADPKDAKKKSNKKNNKKTDPKAKQGNQPPQQ